MSLYVCLYHANCIDGMAAAAVVKLNYPDAELIPVKYGERPPLDKLRHRAVFIVDFCYPPEVLAEIISVAGALTVLDHHESAMLRVRDYGALKSMWVCAEVADDAGRPRELYVSYGTTVMCFVMDHSGASLTWRFLRGIENMPESIRLIRDRDLWRLQDRRVTDFHYGLGIINKVTPEYIREIMFDEVAVMDIIDDGAVARAYAAWRIEEILEQQDGLTLNIAGTIVPAINVPYFLASDAANLLAATKAPTTFAAAYYDTAAERKFSLRSVEGGMTVNNIAAMYGGGGHPRAAGFSLPLAVGCVEQMLHNGVKEIKK